MREKGVMLSLKDLMFSVGGVLVRQAPNNNPRKLDIILTKIRESFIEDCSVAGGDYYFKVIPKEEFAKYIHDLLMGIPEFKELNLSQTEFENGVDVDDPSRAESFFTDRYTVYPPEHWKEDFIDLDAAIRNIISEIDRCHGCMYDEPIKCSTCYYVQKPSDEEEDIHCKTCSSNPNYIDNYTKNPSLNYREGRITCENECPDGYIVCCHDCTKKSICKSVCEGVPPECENVVKPSEE